MNLNFTAPVHPVSTGRPTSFFIEDILLHKPKPLREVSPEHFPGSLASRVPLLDYGYPLMPTPTLLAPHPHPALHKPEHHHHHPYFLSTSGKCGGTAGFGGAGGRWGGGQSQRAALGRSGIFLHPSPPPCASPGAGAARLGATTSSADEGFPLFSFIITIFYFETDNLAFPSRCPSGFGFSSSSAGAEPLLSRTLRLCRARSLLGEDKTSKVSRAVCQRGCAGSLPRSQSFPGLPRFSLCAFRCDFPGLPRFSPCAFRCGSVAGRVRVSAPSSSPLPSLGSLHLPAFSTTKTPNPNRSIDHKNEINEKITNI